MDVSVSDARARDSARALRRVVENHTWRRSGSRAPLCAEEQLRLDRTPSPPRGAPSVSCPWDSVSYVSYLQGKR